MPKVTWTGDASSVEQAQKAIAAGNQKISESYKQSAREAAAAEKAAKKIAEAIDPQARFNAEVKKASDVFSQGKISAEAYGRILQQHRDQYIASTTQIKLQTREMGNLERESEKVSSVLRRTKLASGDAFGPRAINEIRAFGLEILGIGGGLTILIQGFREFQKEREEAAQKAIASRRGLGSLSQLAATAQNPEARFASLVAEARGRVTEGAAIDENEAGALTFELVSAGLKKRDRDLAAKIRAAGTLDNVAGAAQAFDALTASLGSDEVGGFQQFLSKALQAASVAPGSFEALPVALSGAGVSAKELGISDEFLLSAGALLARQKRSPEIGGTLLAAFLRGAEKSDLKDLKGLGGIGLVERFASLPDAKQGFGGELGERAEAVEAFRVLRDNLQEVRDQEAKIRNAQASDLAGRAANLPSTDPQIRAAIQRSRQEGGRDVQAGELFSEAENLLQAALADIAQRKRRDSPGALTEAGIAFQSLLAKAPIFGEPVHLLRSTQRGSLGERIEDPQLNREIRDFLSRIDGNTADTARTQKSKTRTRSE